MINVESMVDDERGRIFMRGVVAFDRIAKRYGLSGAEARIGFLTLLGYTTKEIMELTGISEINVKVHRRKLCRKGFFEKHTGPTRKIRKVFQEILDEVGV